VYAAIHEDDREAVAGAWQQLADGDVAQDEIRYRVRHAGGRIVHVQSRRQRREFGDGGVEVIGAVFDIGEQVRSAALAMQQRQLEAERDRASALAAARTALLAAVSHELRTPLNAIVVASEQLALHAGADEPWIRLLHEASQHLHGLAEDLLEGITLEQRITAEPVEVLDLHEKVDRAARWLAGTAAITGVVIEVDEGLRGRRVQAPRRRLRQVLLNLVGNAVKYNRPGGHVRCTAEVEPSGGMVLLHIRDDGPGMTPEQLDLLFRPFERLGRENGAVHGFGLGLFLVQRFVQEMGGRVGVHSEPGRGTTVTLALPPASADAGREAGAADEAAHGEPLAGMPAASPPRATPAPVPHEGPIHLLCLDDDPFTGTVLAAQLERIGRFELHAVRTLEAALAALAAMQGRGASPDLLLVDLHLGPLTGPQALEALRAAGCATAAVAYTGAADPVAQRSAERAGFAEVWVKPVGTPALREALERVLPGRGLERAAGGGGEPA
jgi:signal transduction histidine kinase/ActR/RegA family two-component response regulator